MDKDGLISKKRKNLNELRTNWEEIDLFAKDEKFEGLSLEESVNLVKPTILIGIFYIKGLSAVGGLFSEKVI